jgi:hypothetical protein
MFWIYKCNSLQRPHQIAYGDWNDFFVGAHERKWGSTEFVPALSNARRGDTILAYQTNRNELVGLAKVTALHSRGRYLDLILRPMKKIGVKVRPLKESDRKIAAIPALQPGPIQTLYDITPTDANRLLRAAGVHVKTERTHAKRRLREISRGAGFGNPESNRLVERAAIKHVVCTFRRNRWTVEDVSSHKRGYDLLCKRDRSQLRVEVKGVAGVRRQFPITAREKQLWATDTRFVLALVTRAKTSRPSLDLFRGPNALRHFHFEPISYIAACE